MAMWAGQDIVDAWTPDGRPAGKQPRAVVQALGLSTTPPPTEGLIRGGLSPVGAPLPPSIPGSVPESTMSAGGMTNQYADAGAVPGSLPPPAPASDAGSGPPPSSGSPAGAGGNYLSQGDAPTKANRLKNGPQLVAPPPAAAAAPMTSEQLANSAPAALDQGNKAIDAQKTAETKVAEDQAAQFTAMADAQERVNAKRDQILEDRAKEADAFHTELGNRMSAYERDAKAIAATKVDRKADHPIMAMIAVALGGLGSALAGNKDGRNPALDMLMQSIDRKVAGQMADLDKRRGDLSGQREQMGMLRETNKDRLAEYDVRVVAAIDQAKGQIEAIKNRSASDQVRAQADVMSAQLDQKRAEIWGTAAERESQKLLREKQFKQQQIEAQQQNAARWAGIAQADRHHKDDLDFRNKELDLRKQEIEASKAAAMAAASGKGNEKSREELMKFETANEERGLVDPVTGDRFLTKEGEAAMKQADALEAQAKAFRDKGDATNADMYAQKATEIRGEARIRHAVRTSSKAAPEINETLQSTQEAVSAIDDIKRMGRDVGKEIVGTSPEAQAMRTKLTTLTLTLKSAYNTGALDDGSIKILREMTGGDPSKLDVNAVTGFLGNAKNTDGALESLAGDLTRRAQLKLKGAGVAGTWAPRRIDTTEKPLDTAAKVVNSDSVTDKLSTAATTGPLDKEAKQLERTVADQSISSNERAAANARLREIEQKRAGVLQNGSALYPGFSQRQEEPLRMAFAAAASSDPNQRARGEQMLLSLTKSTDPSVRAAALKNIKRNAPDLYARAAASVDADTVKEVERDDTERAGYLKNIRKPGT